MLQGSDGKRVEQVSIASVAGKLPAEAVATLKSKAVADKTPAVTALVAVAAARKADVDALTAEKQAADAAKPTATASAVK